MNNTTLRIGRFLPTKTLEDGVSRCSRCSRCSQMVELKMKEFLAPKNASQVRNGQSILSARTDSRSRSQLVNYGEAGLMRSIIISYLAR